MYKDSWGSMSRSLRRHSRKMKSLTFVKLMKNLMPILRWLPNYNWKRDFANDCAAGFTVGVMQVPQGLAYAILANVPPIVGIYTAFFPVLMYILLGTSRHVSMGTFAVVSILTSKPIIELCEKSDDDHQFEDDQAVMNTTEECAVKVMSAIAFMSGVIMLTLGICRLGALNALLTDPLVSGFTTGAGVHVFTSQIKYVFGLEIPKHIGPGRIVKTYIDVFKNFTGANYTALLISFICITILLGFDLCLKPRIAQKCKFPVPMQFIVVILGTVISYATDLKTVAQVRVIGQVPTGLPSPKLPEFSLIQNVFSDTFTITIIGYVVTLSIARIVASKNNYSVDPNQELIAMGTANIFGCFFQSLPMTGSMSRTLVQVSAGGRSLMASIVTVFLLLWVLLFAGPLFEDLPNAILASIIVVSLRGILTQFKDLYIYAKRSYSEVFVWLATFLGTVFIDIDYGLIIGLATSLAFLLWWGYHPKVELVGRTDRNDLFIDKNNDNSFDLGCRNEPAIVRITGNLNLANAPILEDQIVDLLSKEYGENEVEQPRIIILDLNCVSHIDPSACQMLVKNHKQFARKGQHLCYVGMRGNVWRRMTDMKVFSVIPKEKCYPTLQDALAYQSKRHHEL
eukprot:13439.XXX_839671_841919_1 [CDS] Oithona nana genome sequencing.